MRVYSVMPSIQASSVKNVSSTKPVVKTNDSFHSETGAVISFTGSPLHNVNHALSISVEDAFIGLGMYKCGGAGVVGGQLPTALNSHAGMTVKHAVPYYSYNNPKGGLKLLYIPEEYDLDNLPDKMPENLFTEVPADKSLEEIAAMRRTSPERLRFVVQDTPETVKNPRTYKTGTGEIVALKESPFRILIPTDTAGTIQRIDETNLGKLKSIPYKVFKMVIPRKGPDGKVIQDADSVLCIHTPDLASFQKAYTYNPYLKDHPYINLFTRDFGDAAADMLPKLGTKEFGEFRPANVIAHCRTGFPITESIINRSQTDPFYRGFKIVDIFHNPMPNYQGVVDNMLDFLRYKATPEDFIKLTKLPEFPQLLAIDSHRYNLSEKDAALLDRIIKPFLQHYIDDNGHFNQSITPLIARQANPQNISVNHVSHTFANEAVLYDDLVRGLTSHFRAAAQAGDKIEGRPNGCNIDFMQINNPNATMGKNNGLSADMSWYTPYDPKVDSAETIVAAKRKNTRALIDMIGEATEQRVDRLGNYTNTSVTDALNKLFFSTDLIQKQRYVLGGLSKFDEKDIIWTGWGRSDAQKGFPTTLEGFYRYLSNETIPLERRLHSKLLLGSGPDPWPIDGGGDFAKIKEIMHKIQNLAGGKFKKNVCYVNGFFPNRLVTCATYGMFTSTGEPQGLSVPEAIQSGTPTGSINTGGAGEMIVTAEENADAVNGFKTKHAYLVNKEELGYPADVDWSKVRPESIEQRRFSHAADEVAEMFADMAKVYHEAPETYTKMAGNSARAKFDWHNNHALNGGRSTLQLYTEDAMEVQKGLKARNQSPLRRLVGEFGGKIQSLQETIIEQSQKASKDIQKIRNKWTKTIIFTGVAISALGIAAYAHLRRQKPEPEVQLPKLEKTA